MTVRYCSFLLVCDVTTSMNLYRTGCQANQSSCDHSHHRDGRQSRVLPSHECHGVGLRKEEWNIMKPTPFHNFWEWNPNSSECRERKSAATPTYDMLWFHLFRHSPAIFIQGCFRQETYVEVSAFFWRSGDHAYIEPSLKSFCRSLPCRWKKTAPSSF